MFYKQQFRKRPGLHPDHVLMGQDVDKTIQAIFGEVKRFHASHEVRTLVGEMMARTQKIHWASLLNKTVPSPALPPRPTMETLLQTHLTHTQVAQFVCMAIGIMVPRPLLLTSGNWSRLLGGIHKLISGGRHEVFTLSEFTHGMKTQVTQSWTQDVWGSGKSRESSEARKQSLWRVVWYVLDSIVLPLLGDHFYVTETGHEKNKVFYYRNATWARIVHQALEGLEGEMLERVPFESAAAKVEERGIGFAALRFVPKASKVRPIMNLSRPHAGVSSKSSSINGALTPLYQALKYEKESGPGGTDSFQGAVFGYGDVFEAYLPFLTRIRESQAPLFGVALDVSGAFDSLPQDLVLGVTRGLLQAEEYVCSRYSSCYVGGNAVRTRWSRCSRPGMAFESFAEFAENTLAPQAKDSVFTDGVVYTGSEREELLDQLTTHVKENYVRISSRAFKQTRGIPQGSVLSAFLCSRVYSDLHTRVLSGIERDSEGLLVHLIDDFLFLTPDQDAAETLVQEMESGPGVKVYGVSIHPRKTIVSWDSEDHGSCLLLPDVASRSPERIATTTPFLPWCGVLLSMETGEVRGDYRRYFDVAVRDSVTLSESRVCDLEDRLHQYVKPKLVPLLLDGRINTPPTVALNIFEAFALAAIKFHVHMALGRASFRTEIQIKLIESVTTFALRIIRRQIPCFPLSLDDVTSLASSAFVSVLSRKQSRYDNDLFVYLASIESGEEFTWVASHPAAVSILSRPIY